MTQSDIAKKQMADRERWTTRGIAGKATAVNAATNEIIVSLRRGFGGERTMTVAVSDKTKYRRYAENSIKYEDAKTSSLAELKVGDQLRAVGEKNADNTLLTAEEIVFGSFRMVAGKVEAVDTAKREIVIKDLQTNKPITIVVDENTLLRRFPADMANRMAQMQATRAGTQTPNGTGERGTGTARGGERDVDSILEQMPVLPLAELKVGDAVAASSSMGANPDRVIAIKFVAGIEPFLTPAQTPARNNRPQSSPQINIPGLDGFGTP